MKMKNYEDLEFTDDFMFWKVMTQYEGICKKVVELCIGRKVHKIRYKDGQKDFKIFPEGRAVRLDVYLEDDENTLYDFEMQTVPEPVIGRRIRYYDSVMTINALKPGEDYNELPNSYVVFLCTYDPFGKGRAVYEFSRREESNPDFLLDDGSVSIIINAKGNDEDCSEEMREFLSVLRGVNSDLGLGQEIGRAVNAIRVHKEGRMEYMLYEININKARKEGYAEGLEQGRQTVLNGLINLMEYMHITADEAMDIQKIPEDEREYYRSRL